MSVTTRDAIVCLMKRRPKKGWTLSELSCTLCCPCKKNTFQKSDVVDTIDQLLYSGIIRITPEFRMVIA